jgi:hypothetical protein
MWIAVVDSPVIEELFECFQPVVEIEILLKLCDRKEPKKVDVVITQVKDLQVPPNGYGRDTSIDGCNVVLAGSALRKDFNLDGQ